MFFVNEITKKSQNLDEFWGGCMWPNMDENMQHHSYVGFISLMIVIVLAFLKFWKKKEGFDCHMWQLESSILQVSWVLNFVSCKRGERIWILTCTHDGELNIYNTYWWGG